MEKPTPNLKHHQHHAHHSLEHDNQQPSGYKSRDFSSPLEPKLEEQDLPSVPIHKLQSLSAPVVCPKCGCPRRDCVHHYLLAADTSSLSYVLDQGCSSSVWQL
ncbi:hypothetical protein FoTM2_006097 [Fusarium oxysporum f. sp. vasinfectum]|nr:hypothetical protein FoTM2_006097 [Fusarium oxysporum f. sp. vasinfectum]